MKYDVWTALSKNWDHFFWLTGETPDSLRILMNRIDGRIGLCRRRGRLSPMSKENQVKDVPCEYIHRSISNCSCNLFVEFIIIVPVHLPLFQILLTFIWLRRYPTMQHLASQFGISVSLVHKIIHRYIYVLHAYLVPKYIRWHSMPHWRRMVGMIPEWPTVVSKFVIII